MVEPITTKVMFQRYELESAAGPRDEGERLVLESDLCWLAAGCLAACLPGLHRPPPPAARPLRHAGVRRTPPRMLHAMPAACRARAPCRPPTTHARDAPTIAGAAAITALKKSFGNWHGISSLINLGTLITGGPCSTMRTAQYTRLPVP